MAGFGQRPKASYLYSGLVLQSVIAAGTYIFTKGAMAELAPLVFGFYRFILASVIFSLLIVILGKRPAFEKTEWLQLLGLGILAIPINQGFFLVGLSHTPPTHPALLYATTPVWVYLISVWRKEEGFKRKKTVGIAIALAGVTAFFLEKSLRLEVDYLLGDTLLLIAVWAWATYTVLGRRLVQKRGAMNVTAAALILGTIVYFPLGIYTASNVSYLTVTWVGWGGILYSAIFTSVLLYTLWFWTIRYMEPARAAVFSNLQPIFTAILGYGILGERLSVGSVVTGSVIMLGVLVAQRE
jgi:drug/metabolite transporter (DMT)-like permease